MNENENKIDKNMMLINYFIEMITIAIKKKFLDGRTTTADDDEFK